MEAKRDLELAEHRGDKNAVARLTAEIASYYHEDND